MISARLDVAALLGELDGADPGDASGAAGTTARRDAPSTARDWTAQPDRIAAACIGRHHAEPGDSAPDN